MRIFFCSVVLITVTTLFSNCFSNGNSDVLCIQSERQALAEFKQDIKDPSNRLSSWTVGEEDCCKWAAIVCDNLTGHVLEIQLPNPYADYETDAEYEAYRRYKLGGKISPSLLNLKHLNHLDLSCNDFEGIPIPSFTGSLASLSYLNLSQAGFGGIIPYQLGNLSMLHSLSLGGDTSQNQLSVENLQWLSGLPSLQYLEMTFVDLSKANDWLQVINRLSFLVELRLPGCQLNRIPPHLADVNFTSLAFLDLSRNFISDSLIPEWVFTLTSLVYLNLMENHFIGPIPSGLQNATHLRDLDMSFNSLNGTIPNWWSSFSHLENLNLSGNFFEGAIPTTVGNLTSLITLDLSHNQLKGRIPRSLGNLCNLRTIDLSINSFATDVSDVLQSFSGCVLHGLVFLGFGSTQLFGHLSNQIGQLKNLEYLDFDNNSLWGPIPKSIGKLSSLKSLHLSNNKLNGTLPESIGQLTKLEEVQIFNNLLKGDVSEVHFSNLGRLSNLDAAGNKLTFKPSANWVPPFQLHSLDLSSWQLGPQFPIWLQSQKFLSYLTMENTGISDTIPTWFWSMLSHLINLDLSQNQIRGEIRNQLKFVVPNSVIKLGSNRFNGHLPVISFNMSFLNLSNNYFSGSLNNFLCQRTEISNSLHVLHFGNNHLLGEIPNCWKNWPCLSAINLENNNLIGNIPKSMGDLGFLQYLHLRNNGLSGKLPVSLQKCTELRMIDLAKNNFIGSIPTWIGKHLAQLEILNLRSNKFQGNIPYQLCNPTRLQILDLAHNNLWGTIPRCFGNFSGMTFNMGYSNQFSYLVNGSKVRQENAYVVTKGKEFEYNNILGLVRNMDLSENHLSGKIPIELMCLLGLQSLNLSKNHLTGSIPENIGDLGSLESLDLSMNQLSGEIPSSMSGMTFLSYLNLSYNNLTGKIPLSTQLQGFSELSFVNNSLCGPPVTESCNKNVTKPKARNEGVEGDGSKVDWFFVSMVLGFIVGFWAVLGSLLLNMTWRIAYFGFVDKCRCKIYDVICKYCYILNN